MSWFRSVAPFLAVCLAFVTTPAWGQTSASLAAMYPEPQCVSGRAGPVAPDISAWPDTPINRAAKYYFESLDKTFPGELVTLSPDAAGKLRDRLGGLLTGAPDVAATWGAVEAEYLRPRTGTDACQLVWTAHIMALLRLGRPGIALAEERAARLVALQSANGGAGWRERVSQDMMIGGIRQAQGRYRENFALANRALGHVPAPMRAMIDAAAQASGSPENLRDAPRREFAVRLGFDERNEMRPLDLIGGAYFAGQSAVPCHMVARGDYLVFPFPSIAAADEVFEPFVAMYVICRGFKEYFRYRAAATIAADEAANRLDRAGDAVAEFNPAFVGWRQAALYDHAVAFATLSDNQTLVQSLAAKSLEARRRDVANDPLRNGIGGMYDSRVWRARLLSIRASAEKTPQSAPLVNEFIAVSESMPRTSADPALREVAVKTSGGPALQAALASYQTARDAAALAQTALARANDAASMRIASSAAIAALGARDREIAALRRVSPVVASQIEDARPPSVVDVQSALRPGEAVLVLHSLPVLGGVGLVVRKDRAAIVRLRFSREAVFGMAKDLRDAMAKPPTAGGGFAAAESAASVYAGLIAPFAPHLDGVSSLIIVPDDASDDIPWGALLTSRVAGAENIRDFASLPWLVRRYAVSTTPSVGSFVALRAVARPIDTSSFLGIADPKSVVRRPRGSEWERWLASAPPLSRGGVDIMARFAGPGARVIAGADASETATRAALAQRARVITFATHGVFAGALRDAPPALVLGADAQGDGLLTTNEIAGLRLDADLVLLAACDTALGDADPDSETLSGLARAFFVAGARNLVATYWSVSDAAADEFTLQFGSRITKGATLPSATRESAIALIDAPGGGFSHPYYWAAFGAIGAGWAPPAS